MRKRYRGSGKIKLEHGMIDDLRHLLETIEHWPEIHAIVTGVIRPRSASSKLKLTVQYQTSTGLKCLAKSGSAIQELFFVTKEPNVLAKKLNDLFVHP